jgi:hypothetical protein
MLPCSNREDVIPSPRGEDWVLLLVSPRSRRQPSAPSLSYDSVVPTVKGSKVVSDFVGYGSASSDVASISISHSLDRKKRQNAKKKRQKNLDNVFFAA